MSVPVSKRSISKIRFLDNLMKLNIRVREWCKSQSRKNDNYGLVRFYNLTEDIFDYAYDANMIPLDSEENYRERKKLFYKAVRYLDKFNCKVTSIASSFDMSMNLKEELSEYATLAQEQILGIIKSDKKRINRL